MSVTDPATPGTPQPGPAGSSSQPRAYLVGIAERGDVDRLPTAAASATRAGIPLLIALLRPRLGLTTDAALVMRASVGAEQERERMARFIRAALAGCAVDHVLLDVAFRDSRSPVRRARRIAAALSRTARRAGAELLLVDAEPGSTALPGNGFDPSTPVVAVLPDAAAAVRIARTAAELATASNRRLVLLVPVPVSGPSRRSTTPAWPGGIEEDVAAIAGRVRPVLDRAAVAATCLPAPYWVAGRGSVTAAAMATAVRHVVRRLHSTTVVIDAGSPVLPRLRLANVMVHRVPAIGVDTRAVDTRAVDTRALDTEPCPTGTPPVPR